MDSGNNQAGRRSGRIPIHLLLTTENAATSEQQEGTGTAAAERKESAASTGSPSADPPISSPLPISAGPPVHQARNELAYTEYTPLQPRPYPGDRNQPPDNAAGTSSPPWSPSDPMSRRPRAPRPSYSEEQKFFIMYARIMRDQSWPEIEDKFAETFGQRSKGGLTSVYYRARRDWGLAEVLKSGPGTFSADCREVELRAMNFSKAFLIQIGYLPPGS